MFLADTLNRAHIPDVNACDHELSANLEEMDHTVIPLSSYPILQELRGIIQWDGQNARKIHLHRYKLIMFFMMS